MIERIGLRWRLVGLLAAVLVIVALPYIVTRSSSEEALNSRDWVAHTSEVKASVYELAEYLRVLKEGGVSKASVPIRAGEVLVDECAHGQPVNLDDGLPPLADEAAIDKLYAKNHRPKD